jgi:hypothetical protein
LGITKLKEDDMAHIPDDNPETNIRSTKRLQTVKQILHDPSYSWITNSYLRHAIFEAEDKIGSGGASISGNGLASAVIRIGRKILIDMNEFDRWIEGHRMSTRNPENLLPCNTKNVHLNGEYRK